MIENYSFFIAVQNVIENYSFFIAVHDVEGITKIPLSISVLQTKGRSEQQMAHLQIL